MESPLNIALTQRTARQTSWRVVRVLAIAFTIWIGVVLLYRLFFSWSSIATPEGAIRLRLTKTPASIENLQKLAGGLEVIPGVPQSLASLLNTSRQTLTVLIQEDGFITAIIDRELSKDEQNLFTVFGASVSVGRGETIITNATAPINIPHKKLSGFFSTLFLSHDGMIYGNSWSSNISIHKNTITLNQFALLKPPMTEGIITDDTLLYLSISANEISNLEQRSFTQNTPGIQNFFSLANTNGISVILSQDQFNNFGYSLLVPITDETQNLVSESSIKSLAKELTEIPTIDGISGYLQDGSKTTTLRSREEAIVVLRDESPYRFLTATTSIESVTVTETPSILTVTNLSTLSKTPVTTPRCIAGARALIAPSKIALLLPEHTLYESQTLLTALWRVSVIASTQHATRICL